MSRIALIAGGLAAALAAPALAQEPVPPPPPPPAPEPAAQPSAPVAGPGPVQVIQLAAPDAFSTAGRNTGLPAELWRGTPVETARAVLPLLAEKPLSPAAQALARRVLATGATGPVGSAGDEGLAGARAGALLATGDVAAASRILERQPGLDRNADLAHAAAETALLAGDSARACAVAEGLGVGRGDAYWLRLRAYCQMLAGQTAQAQLTFELAQSQARDATYGRLMAARMSGAPAGAASLRNGLDYALSRDLGLDLSAAKPAPTVAAAISGAEPAAPSFDVSQIDKDIGGMAGVLFQGLPPEGGLSALIAAAADADTKSRVRMQGAALLLAALANDLPGPDREKVARFSVPEGKAPAGRALALEAAVEAKRMGEAALLSLWTCADAGAAGPTLGDRVRIVRSLARVGLLDDARLFALEGLAALK
jgi:hypothetical protein